MDNSRQLLIIGYVWPEPASSAAGQHMMQLISVFHSQDWQITFASAAAESEFMTNLKDLGVETAHIKINSTDFDAFIQQLQPEVVLFDRFVVEEQFGWRVAEHCPRALRILDTEDLHCLRRMRKQAIDEDREFQKRDLLSLEVAKREVASIWRCDLSLIISEVEQDLLANMFGVPFELLHYLPFLLDPIDQDHTDQWPDFEDRSHFITIGNFRHYPNRDAVEYIKNKIWPSIRSKLPSAELHVYGAYPSQQVTQLHKPEDGFYIKGRADDAKAVVKQARVCLTPLRFGAGLKGKLVEAMQCGTPSITTGIGAEGIAGELEWSGIIGKTVEDLISAAVKLYTDKSRWQQAQENGIQIINHRFAQDLHVNNFIERLLHLQLNLKKHRVENFIGSMLMHHSLASTKYMSRWIEAKNNVHDTE